MHPMDHVLFCGVRLARAARLDLLRGVMTEMLGGHRQRMIVTPNPEMLVLAHQDPAFRDVLNRADLALPDGVGIAMMSRLLGSPIRRMPGIDFLTDVLFPLAEAQGKTIFFLGAREGVAAEAARAAVRTFPRLKIAGVASGGDITPGSTGDWHRPEDAVLCAEIAAARPDILLVAFGHRKQESWIARHLAELPSVRVAIGVGGAFSFLSGRIRRAPQIVRRAGFEWLWRFFREPWRIRRMINAVLVFPCLVCYDFVKRR